MSECNNSRQSIYREVFKRLDAILLAHISLELIFEYFEALSILFGGAEFGNIKGWTMRHVDDEGIGQHHELVTTSVQFHHVRYFVPSVKLVKTSPQWVEIV